MSAGAWRLCEPVRPCTSGLIFGRRRAAVHERAHIWAQAYGLTKSPYLFDGFKPATDENL